MFTQQIKVIQLWHDDFYLLITITPDQKNMIVLVCPLLIAGINKHRGLCCFNN